jgi:Uma2 family endonuclease
MSDAPIARKSSDGTRSPRGRRSRQPPWTTEVAWLFPRRGQWTEADYLALPETNRIVELSDGKLVIPELPTDPHQYAVGEIFAAIRAFVRERSLGHVRFAPLRVRLWPRKFREPDVVFLSREHEDRRGEEYWGVPDLAVEVISPRTERSSGTERTDRQEKYDEYALAGIAEYWLVDLRERSISVYVLREAAYHLHGKWGAGESARSAILPGLELPITDLFEAEGD